MKKNFLLLFLSISIIYLEFIFKLLNRIDIFVLASLFSICFAIIFASILSLILNKANKKIKVIVIAILLFILGIYYSAQICLFGIYKFYFQFSALALFDQVAAFAGDGLMVIKNNIFSIICMFIPFIVWLIVSIKFIEFKKANFRISLIALLSSLIIYLIVLLIPINGIKLINQTYISNNFIQIVDKLGVLNALFDDGYNCLFASDEVSINNEEPVEEEVIEVIEYDYNNLDIDFKALNELTDNKNIISLNDYFASKTGSKKNEYTSLFEGKNLILFMAESFNGICVNKDLTPTLYKLVHDGFDFTNFYSPTVLSTIGGEYAELTSLYPELGPLPNSLSIFRSDKNEYPMGIGNLFKEKGYTTRAYHNSDYDFQDRNIYLANLGFDSFNACGLGLEKKVNCRNWPKSDIELIEATFDDYINDDKFLVFYATVSGHGGYSFTEDNDIAPKYEQLVREYYKDKLPNDKASDMLMAYEAGQIELDRALQLLLGKLETAGKLNDTVIALVGDHHPYYLTDRLSMNEYNRLSTYERDEAIELYHSNFILYNAGTESVVVDKVGSQIDVLPTIYNLFGLNFDSRLLMGNDLLSKNASIAIMGDNSWVNDKGKYFAYSNTFEGSNVSDLYISQINTKVENIKKISRLIMQNNYYKFVYDNIN